MKKSILSFVLILMVILNLSAQDTLNLLPPTNLQVVVPAMTDYALLTWNAPVDSATGEVPQGLLGYNIYRDDEVIASIDHPETEYYDLNLINPTYTYQVSAVYDLTLYGFPGETGVSPFAGPVIIYLNTAHELPFTENFTTGLFETNMWTDDGPYGDNNWQIAGQTGNPAPGTYFTNYYPRTGYSRTLTSWWFNGSGFIDGQILMDFDFKKEIVNPTQTEFLFVDVYNGNEWIQVKEFTNDESSDWQTYTINITNEAFGHLSKIRFRAEGQSTANILSWEIDNIMIYRQCEPATDLYAELTNFLKPCIVLCEWEYSEPYWNGEWLQWDNGENDDAVGALSGGMFYVASRFTSEQLQNYAGGNLTKIKFFPYDSAVFVLKVWTGDSASQLMLSQPVLSYTVGEWNEITLDTPIFISGTTELWFGYLNDGDYDSFPAGLDSGPNVTNYGDLLSFDGQEWETLTNIGFVGNWNLAGFVDFPGETTRSLSHFNIYREDEYIGSTGNQFYYDTLTLPEDMYCYKVTAVYDDCESDFSNIDCYWLSVDCSVGVDDIDLNQAQLYPNPASSLITVEVNQPVSEFRVYNLQGNQIGSGLVPDRTTTLDVSRYPDGIYLIKFIGRDGSVFGKKLVVE